MKRIIAKISITLMLIVTIAGIFHSCKKIGNDSTNNLISEQADAATVQRVKNAILSGGKQASTSIVINQPASDVYFSDANNNRIDLRSLIHHNVNGITPDYVPVCDYQVDVNGDPVPSMLPANFNLNSTGFIFDCGTGGPTNYRVTFDWSLAVQHLIQAQNTFGTAGATIRSRFTLKVKNSAGAIIATYTNNFIPTGNITDLGDWTVDPTRRLFGIKASINVPSTIFSSGVTYETTLTLATNCNLTPQLSAVHTTTSVSSLNTQPCKRTDKVWINPGTGPGGVATAAGTFVVCAVPSGYTVTANHDLQFRLRNTTVDAWDSQTSTIISPSPFSTYTGVINLTGTTSGSGTWLIRYRNNNSCTPFAPWIVEKWPL